MKWVYVETKRTSKKTGETVGNLEIWLCDGEKAIRKASDINSAYQYEMANKDKLKNSVNDLMSEQRLKWSSNNPDSFVDTVPKISKKEFNKLYKKQEQKQTTIFYDTTQK